MTRTAFFSTTARTAVALALAAGLGAAQAADSRLSNADAAFLKQAAQNNAAEIEGSKLALDKSSNADVKSFAQQMVEDHTKAGEELASLASSKGLDVPKEPSMTQRGKAKLLEAMSGDRFDKQYADSIGVTAHQDTVKLFRTASTNAKDADVKAFATKTLPTLEHHLQMAQQMKTAVHAHKAAAASGSMTTAAATQSR